LMGGVTVSQLFELYRPQLRNPVLLAAFAGWNDAAEVATGTLRALMRQWNAEPCAEIEPEEFFVFTETRPQVRIVDNIQRRIVWPQNQFYYARPPGGERDILFLVGTEPQLKWKTFTGLVLDYAKSLDVNLVVCLGGLLADVLHSNPPVLTGSVAAPDLAPRASRLGLHRSRYEGPTGIVGVLGSECRPRDIPTGSIWGNVPHYLPGLTNPPIMEAMARAVGDLLDITVDAREFHRGMARFKLQVERAIAEDVDVAAYVRQLEERDRPSDDARPAGELPPPSDLPSADVLVQELEEFFRRRPEDGETK
jgi:proteasome assembly chaperone (PAC2) family protein